MRFGNYQLLAPPILGEFHGESTEIHSFKVGCFSKKNAQISTMMTSLSLKSVEISEFSLYVEETCHEIHFWKIAL